MRRRVRLAAVALTLVALPFALATAIAIAGGINFGYAVHPQFFVAAAILGAITVALGAGAVRAQGLRSVAVAVAAPLALVGIAFGAFVAWNAWSGPTPAEVAVEQAPLYDHIPAFPGATPGRVIASKVPPDGDLIAEGYLNRPTCCDTSRVDVVGGQEPVDSVAAFYRRVAVRQGWRVRFFDDGADHVQLLGRRGKALLIVEIDVRAAPPSVVTISVLPTGNELCDTPQQEGCW
jgi:hypothetical protein